MCGIVCKKTIINSLSTAGANALHLTAFNAIDPSILEKISDCHPDLFEELAELTFKLELLSNILVNKCQDLSGETKRRNELLEKLAEQMSKNKKKSFLKNYLSVLAPSSGTEDA